MTIRLIREPSIHGATHGSLYVNGHWQCWTLEDQIREVEGQPVEAWKVPAQTAIPAGRYRVTITPSQRFKRDLPLLAGVPGFLGVRIHPGNDTSDTEGCILLGKDRQPGRVLRSRFAFAEFESVLRTATSEVWIVIENPLADPSQAA